MSEWIFSGIGVEFIRRGIPSLKGLLTKKGNNVRHTPTLSHTKFGTRFYLNRGAYMERRRELFANSTDIRLHSIFANLSHQGLKDLIEEALENQKAVQILIADQSSNYIRGEGNLQLALMDDETPERIGKDLRALYDIFRRRKDERWQGTLEVKTHHRQPMWSIYIFDDELFASPYLYRNEGDQSPCIHARKMGPELSVFDRFHSHYETLWRDAAFLDLSVNI